METIKVTVYKTNYENKNYLTTFQIKKYKQLKRIKEKLKEFIQLQEDEKHNKILFYCFSIKLTESDLYYKPKT